MTTEQTIRRLRDALQVVTQPYPRCWNAKDLEDHARETSRRLGTAEAAIAGAIDELEAAS